MTTGDAKKNEPVVRRARWLDDHRTSVQSTRNNDHAIERRWSWMRLLTFGAAAGVWVPLHEQAGLAVTVSAAMLLLFALSVVRHGRAKTRRVFGDRLLTMVTEAQRRCGGAVILIRSLDRPADPTDTASQLTPILDDGPTWTLTEQERDDFDMHLPPVGLFGILNRTSTIPGARRLRDMIDRPCLSIDRILARQAMVRFLDEDPARRLRIMAAAAAFRETRDSLDQLAAAVRTAKPPPSSLNPTLMRAWGVLSGLFTLLALGMVSVGGHGWGAALFVLLMVNSLAYMRMHKTLNRILARWRNLAPTIQAYLTAAGQPAEDLPDSTELTKLRTCFADVVQREVLPSLRRRIPWADVGGMFHVMANIVFFYDLQVAGAVLNRVVAHRDALLSGLSALADLEALTSLACLGWESAAGGATCYPTIVPEPSLVIQGGRHPLIEPEAAVANDIALNAETRMWIITGSNMAGKSTLLRMVGVNTLLAQMGTRALAREMTLTPLRLMTDLRTGDNLAAEESYFLAEVRHVRRMVLPPDGAQPLLGLIDEPFRGTNSEEQVAAGLAVTEHLLASDGLFILATHERRLTELASRGTANHHFREALDGDGLVFDYRLHPGPAATRNALRVLEREGYPAALLASARRWLEQTQEAAHPPENRPPRTP